MRIGDLPLATYVRPDDVILLHQGGVGQLVQNADIRRAATIPAGISRKSQLQVRNVQSTTYTVTIDDTLIPTVILMNTAGANSVILPSGLVSFLIGAQIAIIQYGAGQTTVVPGGGATVRTASSYTTKSQYSRIEATYTDLS